MKTTDNGLGKQKNEELKIRSSFREAHSAYVRLLRYPIERWIANRQTYIRYVHIPYLDTSSMVFRISGITGSELNPHTGHFAITYTATNPLFLFREAYRGNTHF